MHVLVPLQLNSVDVSLQWCPVLKLRKLNFKICVYFSFKMQLWILGALTWFWCIEWETSPGCWTSGRLRVACTASLMDVAWCTQNETAEGWESAIKRANRRMAHILAGLQCTGPLASPPRPAASLFNTGLCTEKKARELSSDYMISFIRGEANRKNPEGRAPRFELFLLGSHLLRRRRQNWFRQRHL